MLQFDKQLEIYEIAKQEDGVAEIPGKEQNPRIIEYHSTTSYHADHEEVAWCSSFVNWCCHKAKIIGTGSAAARSWLKWGQEIISPQIGDIVILKRGKNPKSGHVGFFEGKRSGMVKVFAGNQHDKVCSMYFNEDQVLGYRRYVDPRTGSSKSIPDSKPS